MINGNLALNIENNEDEILSHDIIPFYPYRILRTAYGYFDVSRVPNPVPTFHPSRFTIHESRANDITDAAGNVTRFIYELIFNQVIGIIDPKGNTTSFVYDDKGNLIKTIDAAGNVTEMEYNAKGLLVEVTDAEGGVT